MNGSINERRSFVVWSISALACALVPGGCGEKGSDSPAHVVERGPFTVVHEEDGEIEAQRTLTISSRKRGQLVFVVKDHTHVEKDDVLVELDKSDLESNLKRTQDELAAVRRKLEENERSLEIQRSQLEIDLERKIATLDLAGVRLKTAREGAEPEDLSIAGKNVEAARAALEFAESAYDDTKSLVEKGFATESELAEEVYNLAIGRARFEKAALKLRTLKLGPTAHELRPYELDVEQAQIELDIARMETASGVSGLERSVAWSRAEVWRLEERTRRTERELEQCTIKAPRAGLALRVWRHWERGKIDAGMRTWPGIGLVELPDLSAFKVKTQTPESVIRHFEIGKDVPVEIEGLEGEVFTGRVTWIDTWARDKNAELAEADQEKEGLSGVRVFDTHVALDKLDERMKLGSSAKVELRSVLDDVVFVDRRAVEWRRGRPFVRVLEEDGSVRPVPVVLGESNERYYMILEGEGAGPGTPVAFRDGG